MRTAYIFCIATLLVVLATCASTGQQLSLPGSQQVETGPFPLSKWTVLIYMSADNELDKYAMRNIHEMEAVAPPRDAAHPGVTVLVQLDRSSDNTAPESWKDTRRYHIVRDPEMARLFARVKNQRPPQIPDEEHPDSPVYKLPGRIPHTLTMDAMAPVLPTTGMDELRSPRLDAPALGKLDMGDPKTLNSFIHWGQQIAPAEHYLVFTWGHGCGWTLDDDALPDDTPTAKSKSFCEDDGYDNDGTSINSAQISQALQGTRHIDVLAMDNCMMAMFEVAYQVRGQVDYLTASEDEVPDRGFDYFDTLGTLTRLHGDIASAAVARGIAENNETAWQHYGFGNTLTNSTIIPSRTPPAAQALTTLVQRLLALQGRYTRQLQRARTECIQFGMVTDYEEPSDIVDLCDYLHRLIRYVPDDGVRQAARAAEQAVRACVLANYTCPPYAFAKGVSIYVPPASTMTQDYIDTYGAFAFCHDTNWLQWLTKSP